MAVNGVALGALGVGVILLWSGVQNKGITQTTQDLISGKKPAPGPKPSLPQDVASNTTAPAGSVPGGEPNVKSPAGPGETAWIVSFLASIGAPPTPGNVQSVTAWIAHEAPWNAQPPDGAQYTHNPLNTTEPGFGAVGDVNSVGVKIYPNAAAGLAATQAVITNGRYGDILMYLRSGRGLCGLQLPGLSTWSGGGYSSVC